MWFCGFFDGEGSLILPSSGNRIRMTLTQKDPELLERAQKLVGGSITKNGGKGMFRLEIYRINDIKAILNDIFPYMSLRRREKIKECLKTIK